MEIFSHLSGISQVRNSTFMLVKASRGRKQSRNQQSATVFRSRGFDLRSQRGVGVDPEN